MLRRLQRPQTRIPAGASQEDEDAQWGACAALIDDTLSSIQLLSNRNARGFASLDLPPLILWHQLYAVLPNRTFIDQSVHRLRKSAELLAFPVPTGVSDTVLIRRSEFLTRLDRSVRLLETQRVQTRDRDQQQPLQAKLDALTHLRRALPQLCGLQTITMTALVQAFNGDIEMLHEQAVRTDVMWLHRLGYLLPTVQLNSESFHLSVPAIGKLVTAVKKTRTALLSTIKRTRYKQVAEQQLKKTKLRHSPFELEYHLADMEGCGLVHRTKVTSGTLVTLVDR